MFLRSPDVLRALMRQQGFSMQALATRAGCSKSFIGFLANGTKTSCSPELAAHIAEALAVPAGVLFAAAESTRGGRRGDRTQVA